MYVIFISVSALSQQLENFIQTPYSLNLPNIQTKNFDSLLLDEQFNTEPDTDTNESIRKNYDDKLTEIEKNYNLRLDKNYHQIKDKDKLLLQKGYEVFMNIEEINLIILEDQFKTVIFWVQVIKSTLYFRVAHRD